MNSDLADPPSSIWHDIWAAPNQLPTLYSDCRFDCNKIGTINGVCEKNNGHCQCRDGFFGDVCDKGKKVL